MKKFLWVILLLLSCIEARNLKVTLISEDVNSSPFWGVVNNFAKASAKDLGIDLKIIYNDWSNRYSYIEAFEEEVSSKNKPDFIIGVFLKRVSVRMVELSKKYDVPLFVINTDASFEDKEFIGEPRVTYENYIGIIAPDEKKSGYVLAKHLIEVAKRKNLNKQIKIVGISGSREGPESERRNMGLKLAAKEKNAKLYQIVFADWNGKTAYNQSKKLIKRYKDLDVIWTASDLMALNVKKSINELGKEKIVTGGIDWTKEGIEGVKNGKLEGSVGGHIADAAIALVLLYDYYYGKDFYTAKNGGRFNSEVMLLTKENVDSYYEFLTKQDWDSIDFRKFSKVLNPKLKKYDFSFGRFLNER